MKSDIEWKYWGKEDPLYGVATWAGRNKSGDAPWTDADFYAIGQRDWACFHPFWMRYGLDAGHCVEIGCGAGRLTRFMAETFERVSALDVSEDMIAYARKHISNENVVFHLVSEPRIPLEASSCDAVFSTHVFQHFDDKEDAADYFSEIHRVLRSGGTMMIHLPFFTWPHGARWPVRTLFQMIKATGRLRAGLKRLMLRVGINLPLMRMTSYESAWLVRRLSSLGFEKIELTTFGSDLACGEHSFLLAKKL